MEGGATKKTPPPAGAGYLSELRIEGSSAVGFSEPCPCCGNRKRRCLKAPAAARKKLLVFDSSPSPSSSASALPCRSESSPLPSTASPSALVRRSVSSPLPSSASPSATLTTSLGLPPYSFSPPNPIFPSLQESAAETARSPPPGPSCSTQCSDPIPPMSPPASLKKKPVADPQSDRRLEMSSSTAKGPVSSAAEDMNKQAAAEEESGVSEGHAREELRVSVSCRCGVVREIVLHR